MRHIYSKQTGFTLLEVLIAFIILVFGLLGLAGLQATSLLQNHNAALRSQATLLAYDISDRMRSNIGAVDSYRTASAAKNTGCESITGCTNVEMAKNDLFHWEANLTSKLPSGTGDISILGSTYKITVSWDDNRDGSVDADDSSFTMELQL